MRKSGLTLSQLIPLVAVLGVLACLLMPAAMHARVSARQAECTNKLHDLAIAFHNYHDVKTVLPPGEAGHSNGVFALCQPYMEKDDTAQKLVAEFDTWLDHNKEEGSGAGWWTTQASWDLCKQSFAEYYCPAVDIDAFDKATRNITAVRYERSGSGGKLTINYVDTERGNHAGLTTYAPSAGICGMQRIDMWSAGFGDFRQGMFSSDRTMAMRNILDGTSYTLAIGEYMGGYDSASNSWTHRASWAGGVTMWTAMPVAASAKEAHWSQFSSPHDGITNVALGDAAVRPLRNSIDLELLRNLSGIRDGVNIDIN